MFFIDGTDLPAYDPQGHKNGSGEDVRPSILWVYERRLFQVFEQGNFIDAVDPVNAIGVIRERL